MIFFILYVIAGVVIGRGIYRVILDDLTKKHNLYVRNYVISEEEARYEARVASTFAGILWPIGIFYGIYRAVK